MNAPAKTPLLLILIGVLATLALLFIVTMCGRPILFAITGMRGVNATIVFISSTLHWICLLLVWFYASRIEKQDMFLWQEQRYKLWHYPIHIIAIFFFIFLLAFPVLVVFNLFHLVKLSTKITELKEIVDNNKPLLVFIALTAGIVEEAIFRGYLLPRFELLFKNSYLAIAISSILFGLLHFKYGTIINVVGPFIIGLIFAYHYWKYRNIKIVMIAHFLWDLLSLSLKMKH